MTACAECARLRAQVDQLTATVRDQARALAEFADDVPPWAPSLAIVYWLYGPTRWHEPCWPTLAAKLRPLIRDVGSLPAQKLTPMAWAEHVSRRKTERDRRGNLPKDTQLNMELTVAKMMLSWAVANKIPGIRFNPLQPARAIPTAARRETAIGPGDLDRLLESCDAVVDRRADDDDGTRGKTLRAFVLCLFDSMLRFSEAHQLRWDRIGGDGRVEIIGKGRKRRTVFLTYRTMDAIEEVPRDPLLPQVFVAGGRLLAQMTMRRWFRIACKHAGVDALVSPGDVRLRPHDLRASGATTADELGARPTAIRDTLGHASLKTTEIYLRSDKSNNSRHVGEKMTELDPRRGPKKVPRSTKKILQAQPRL